MSSDYRAAWLRAEQEIRDLEARVEAELSRLREERDALERLANRWIRYHGAMQVRALAAEARCARLQQALREIEQIDERDDSRPIFFGLQSAFFKAQRIAREALAGPDTPADTWTAEELDEAREKAKRQGEAFGWRPADSQKQKCVNCGSEVFWSFPRPNDQCFECGKAVGISADSQPEETTT